MADPKNNRRGGARREQQAVKERPAGRNRRRIPRNAPDANGARKFTKEMQTKLVVLFSIVLLAFSGLGFRLYVITRDNSDTYKKQVLSHQAYSSTTLPYRRGDILDSKGTKLAFSEKVYNVILDCKVMNSGANGKYVDPTMNALFACIPAAKEKESEIRAYQRNQAHLYEEDHDCSAYYVTARLQSYEEISDLQEKINEEDSLVKGIWFEEEYIRSYPYGSLASDVIGFTTKDGKGTLGLEEYYNDTLSGTNGREYGYLNDDANLERTTKAAVDGYSLVTTIDANIQSIVEEKLRDFDEQYRNNAHYGNGAENVGCIIQDVNNGEILAMASFPTFDLNDLKNPQSLVGSYWVDEKNKPDRNNVITQEMADQWKNDKLLDDPEVLRQFNNLWKNFCIVNAYEPGSTMKPFTVAAGLESGSMTGNETYNCTGSVTIIDGEKPIKCHNVYGDGILTVAQAVERSCNVALMRMGQAIGKTTFLKYMSLFNFGLKTNVDLAGEARTASLVFTEKTMGPTELATSTFGQGFNVTMIEMITGFSSLVNGGYYYEPHMVKQIVSSDGSVVKNIEPRVLKQTISEENSAKIRDYCLQVVIGEHGTGKTARPAGYMIGGKTGTAETVPRGIGQYVVSFMGYAPADNPQIAIYVVVDRPNVSVQDDAKFATRIVRAVLTDVLPYLDIFRTEPLSEKEAEELEAQEAARMESIRKAAEEAKAAEAAQGSAADGTAASQPTQEGDAETTGAEGESAEGAPAEETGADDETDEAALEEAESHPNMSIDPDTGLGVLEDGSTVDPNTGETVGDVDLGLPDVTAGGGQDDNSPY